MTSKADWIALAERCEKATVTDRKIDVAILLACGWKIERRERDRKEWLYSPNDEYHRQDPLFLDMTWRISRSLDAITALIERELPCRDVHSGTFRGRANGMIMNADGTAGPWREAATEPLTRCAAFCRAMAEKAA
jgi:hypothetical protein